MQGSSSYKLPNPLTLRRSLKSVRLKLWDEKRKLLLSFREMALQLLQNQRMALRASSARRDGTPAVSSY